MKNKNLFFQHEQASDAELKLPNDTPSLKSVYSGVSSAKKYSTPALELKIESYLNRPLDKGLHPYTSGMLFEYLSREPNIPESIKSKIKTSNVNWKEYFEEFSKDRRTSQQASILNQSVYWGSFAGLIGLTTVLIKDRNFMRGETSEARIRDFTNKIKNRYGLDTAVDIERGFVGSHYNPVTDTVRTNTQFGVAAHELGHAKNFANYKKVFGQKGGVIFGSAMYGGVQFPPHVSVPFPSIAALPLLSRRVTNRIQGNDPNSTRYKLIQKAEDNPGTMMALSTTPRLLEELTASGRAVSNVLKYEPHAIKSTLRTLTPAFGTYLMSALPLIGLGYASGLRNKKQDELRLKNKIQILKQASLPQQIEQQHELTTQLQRQIQGSHGPLANFLRTPLLGDQKLSRTSGLNSTPQAQAIQKQHSPNTHRVIGKKFAAASDTIAKYFTIPGLATTGYSSYRGISDDENNIPVSTGILASTGFGATATGLGSLAYQLFHKPTPYNTAAKRLAALIAHASLGGLVGAGVYGVARSGDATLEKLIYEQNNNTGNTAT